MGTAHKGYVYDALASVTSGQEISVSQVATISITDGGSFAGTIELHRKPPGASAYAIVESGSWTEADLPVTKTVVESHAEVKLKLVCSARTAGTANCSITSNLMNYR